MTDLGQIRKSYKLKLRPSAAQTTMFLAILDLCRELYNAALQERRDAWRKARVSVSFRDQQAQLPDIRRERPDVGALYQRVALDVLFRVDRAFQGFFRRVRAGEKPGYPRFMGRDHYSSFSYLNGGFKVQGLRLKLSKIGSVRFHAHGRFDPARVEIKTVTIKREADAWYAVLACVEPAREPLPETGLKVGIDVGLHALVATSEGEIVPVPSHLKTAQKRLSRQQRIVSRRHKGSRRRRKAVRRLARAHKRLRETRALALHRITTPLVDGTDLIAIEALNVAAMGQMGGRNASGRGYRRSIRNAAWGILRHQIVYKAAWAGRRVVEVDPKGTSQTCSGCGRLVPKTLADRTHRCDCGQTLDRDVNAARNTLKRALAGPSGRARPSRTPEEPRSRVLHNPLGVSE